MNARVLLLLALAAGTASDSSLEVNFIGFQRGYGSYSDEAQYEHHYLVQDDYGNNYGQQETRHGGRTTGSFYVFLPDTRLQKVYYHVDGDSGFVADVGYEGEAQYDSNESYEGEEDQYRDRKRSSDVLYGDRK